MDTVIVVRDFSWDHGEFGWRVAGYVVKYAVVNKDGWKTYEDSEEDFLLFIHDMVKKQEKFQICNMPKHED